MAINKWLELPSAKRAEFNNTAGINRGLPVEAIEKDWWITMTLKALFGASFAENMVFKGGTSLSKGWNLIERFSEDIDLAIDRAILGFEGELTKKRIKYLRRESGKYIRETVLSELIEQLNILGIDRQFYTLTIKDSEIPTNDPQTIILQYQSDYQRSPYIPDTVKIEIGSRSLMEPHKPIKIRSIIAEEFPNTEFADPFTPIPTVIPQRTFLEKAFLLHEEFQKPEENIRIERMSRHLYDLERLMDTDFARKALKDVALYKTIVDHRSKLTAISGIDYSTHSPDRINFVPPQSVMEKWRDDYSAMQASMIYGESLPFGKLLERIALLNKRFREI